MPLISDRVKRSPVESVNKSDSPAAAQSTQSTPSSSTTTANKIYDTDDSSSDSLQDDFLKKQVFLNKTSLDKNFKTHEKLDNFTFNNNVGF